MHGPPHLSLSSAHLQSFTVVSCVDTRLVCIRIPGILSVTTMNYMYFGLTIGHIMIVPKWLISRPICDMHVYAMVRQI